ncbi:MAG TPA: DNA repair protein RadC [Polyangiaceae bacterium]|jgi:DNA repair protein RadC
MTQSLVGARERAREVGIRDLADSEVVALVLGTGIAGEPVLVLAASLIEELGGIESMARVGFGAMAARRGIGAARALRLAAAFELGRRARVHREDLPWAPDSRAVAAWARSRLADLEHEELWVLALDGQHRVRAARRVASGGLHGLSVSVRDPLRFVLREAASAFVVVHNHPSGDPTPSLEDLAFTERLMVAADAVSTPLLDHVIVAGEQHRSMLDDGFLTETKRAGVSLSRGGKA